MEIVREEERTRIAREVHDELAQGLTALKLELSLLDKKLSKAAPKLQPKAQMMIEMIDSVLPGIKKLIIDLRPPILDDLGLAEAIEWQGKDFENRTGVRFQFDHGDQKVNLSPGRATTLFRIFQETLTNITRHAQAKNIHVTLVQSGGAITLKVLDDGRGITKKEISNSKSFGLLGMQERALVWGGNISITGKPKKGTSVTIQLDCQDSTGSALPEKTS